MLFESTVNSVEIDSDVHQDWIMVDSNYFDNWSYES